MISIAEAILNLKDSLGIKRKDMPQIDQKDIKEFMYYMGEKKVTCSRSKAKAESLKPCQSELDTDKADKIYNEEKSALDIPIFISEDNYVLDGHHRWLACMRNEPKYEMACYKIGAKAEEALELMRGFDGVKYKDIKDKKVSEDTVVHITGGNGTHFHIRTDSNRDGQWWDTKIWRETGGKKEVYDKKRFNSEAEAKEYIKKNYDKYENYNQSLSSRILEATATSFYLVGGFKGEELKDKHLTVTYFGKRNSLEKKKIAEIIEKHISEFNPLTISFSKEAMFGPNNDVRVLLPENASEKPFRSLREALMPFNGSQFKNEYRPHVATKDETYTGTIDRLALCQNEYKVVKEYKLKSKSEMFESVKDQIKKEFNVEDGDFEKADKDHSVTSIAKTKEGYVGFSHRAAHEFKIGDKIYDPEWGKDKYSEEELGKMAYRDRGSKTIKTMEQAREAACRFAEEVS